MHRRFVAAALIGLWVGPAEAAVSDRQMAIADYIRPYVATNNFSGAILVARSGQPLFVRSYGYADRRAGRPNNLRTRFHIASMSMQFTAAAALRLIDKGQLSLETPVGSVLPDYPGGDRITIRNLLTQTSGIADINSQPGYAEILKSHQTPASLVQKVKDLLPLRKPGTYDREEHSAFNLLALIIERETGLPFDRAMLQLVFKPLGMHDSGIDDDSAAASLNAALGYQPDGLYDLAKADPIHWSAKAGNGSAFTTVGDELKFVRGLYRDEFISPALRRPMFDLGNRVGYGWFKSNSVRFGQPVYSMNGRAPGFASAIIFVPREHLLVVALSNVYASVPAEMATEITAIAVGKPFEALNLQRTTDPASLVGLPAAFHFAKDFYQPNAVVRVAAAGGAVTLHWPSGETSVLIPTAKDKFVDRNYWVPVELVRDEAGRIEKLKYDRFFGELTGS